MFIPLLDFFTRRVASQLRETLRPPLHVPLSSLPFLCAKERKTLDAVVKEIVYSRKLWLSLDNYFESMIQSSLTETRPYSVVYCYETDLNERSTSILV